MFPSTFLVLVPARSLQHIRPEAARPPRSDGGTRLRLLLRYFQEDMDGRNAKGGRALCGQLHEF